MRTYEFAIVLAGVDVVTDDIANDLFEAGCSDGSPFSSEGVSAVGFNREAPTLEDALKSAVADVEKAGLAVARVEIDSEALAALTS